VPGHLQPGLAGKGRGEASAFQGQRHLGRVPAGAGLGAGEDQAVHGVAPQRAGTGLAHGPAQRLGEVALAAAIGSDQAGEAGQHVERDRVGKALKA